MKRLLLRLCLVAALAAGCPSARPKLESAPTVVSSDPAPPAAAVAAPQALVFPGLGPLEDLPGFAIRPPADFTRVEDEGNAGDRLVTWQGPLRPDGTMSILSVGYSDPRREGSEAFKGLMTADKVRLEDEWVLNMTLSMYGSSSRFERGKAERLTINGQPFVRARFQTPVREDAAELAHGWLYVMARPDRVVEIWAMAPEPEHEAFLPLAEQAAATFVDKPAAEAQADAGRTGI